MECRICKILNSILLRSAAICLLFAFFIPPILLMPYHLLFFRRNASWKIYANLKKMVDDWATTIKSPSISIKLSAEEIALNYCRNTLGWTYACIPGEEIREKYLLTDFTVYEYEPKEFWDTPLTFYFKNK